MRIRHLHKLPYCFGLGCFLEWGFGGGIYLEVGGTSAEVDLYNNIIWGNSASYGEDILINNWNDVSVNAHNNDFDPARVTGSFTNQGGNINVDPLFVDAANGDYHLATGSLCIDSGNNSAPSLPLTDFEGDGRVLGAAVDIGADEFFDSDGDGMPDGWEVSHGLNPLVKDADGDADSDGFTNLEEYLAGTDPKDPRSKPLNLKGDINADGTVNLVDAIMALQVLTGMNPNNVNRMADVNGDGRIGVEEVIFVFQKVSGLR